MYFEYDIHYTLSITTNRFHIHKNIHNISFHIFQQELIFMRSAHLGSFSKMNYTCEEP